MEKKKKVNLSKMNKLAVITIANDRVYRDDAEVMIKSGSLTKSFFKRMQQCNYRNGENCVISNNADRNLILAHYDNDAIFLLSENPILSPTEFINAIKNLQNSSIEMKNLLDRRNVSGYSTFNLSNLNINFVNLALVTGMSLEVIEHYLSEQTVKEKEVKTKYDDKQGIISHTHSSQHGTNLVTFLNEIIEVNPDIRLLMSNVVCRDCPINLEQAMIDALGFKNNPEKYKREDGLLEDDYKQIIKNPIFENDDQFLSAFEKEKQYQIKTRANNNKKYKIYSAFKYVVELSGKTKDMDEKYLLKWYDGDPDNGGLAISTALDSMIMTEMREDDSYVFAPRVIPEIKDYMQVLNKRAHNLSKNKMLDKGREHISKS